MICPVCKCDMIVVEYHNIELDHCTCCKGVWFDSGELELLLEACSLEGARPALASILNSPEAESPEKKRKCPICGRKMKKTTIGEKPQILIDVCGEEHGLWFDGGEVIQLMKQLAVELPEQNSGEKVLGFMEEVFEAPE